MYSNARSPRIHNDKMVFLSNAEQSPHASTSKLILYDFTLKTFEEIVPILDIPNSMGFPGLYLDQYLILLIQDYQINVGKVLMIVNISFVHHS